MSKLLAAIVAGMFAIGTTGVFAAADTGAPKDAPKKLSAAECKDPKNKDHADCKPAAKKDEMKK